MTMTAIKATSLALVIGYSSLLSQSYEAALRRPRYLQFTLPVLPGYRVPTCEQAA